ncbi:hypothetical protein HYPSUDRAFT_220221 [Hypholoma sublateritium FD-334 SS-4]|uniref:Uncharacterized protein n=1 Tax=Hypholoma sublateritium (strain FD-334 SS-4) TaxID=945553 RepID=A0A0D2KK11_HYPSF|nr:hypothetical protein HYPSUDRAFT_220221 [Hypholoma sublateritium FD-334 SS-4]
MRRVHQSLFIVSISSRSHPAISVADMLRSPRRRWDLEMIVHAATSAPRKCWPQVHVGSPRPILQTAACAKSNDISRLRFYYPPFLLLSWVAFITDHSQVRSPALLNWSPLLSSLHGAVMLPDGHA